MAERRPVRATVLVRAIFLAAGVIALVLAAPFAHLGYLGGEVFRTYPARGASSPAERGIGVVSCPATWA